MRRINRTQTLRFAKYGREIRQQGTRNPFGEVTFPNVSVNGTWCRMWVYATKSLPHDIENMYTLYTERTLIIGLNIFLPRIKKLWHLPPPSLSTYPRHRSAGLRSSSRHANVKHATQRNASGTIFVESVHGRTREYIAEHLSWATRRVTTVWQQRYYETSTASCPFWMPRYWNPCVSFISGWIWDLCSLNAQVAVSRGERNPNRRRFAARLAVKLKQCAAKV